MMLTDPRVDNVLNAATQTLEALGSPVTPASQYNVIEMLHAACLGEKDSEFLELKEAAFKAMSRLTPHLNVA